MVNEEALSRWMEILPGCGRFLSNFFGTCGAFPPEVNYLNYRNDLWVYAETNTCIRRNRVALVRAFHDITGTKPDELEMAVQNYIASGGG